VPWLLLAVGGGAVVGVLLGECRREKRAARQIWLGAGVGGAYVTAAKIWRACPAPRRSDARLWALPALHVPSPGAVMRLWQPFIDSFSNLALLPCISCEPSDAVVLYTVLSAQ